MFLLQDLDRRLATWFSERLNARYDMIRTPPQHNTTNPPGQIVNPINQSKTLDKEIEEYMRRCRCNDVAEKCETCPNKETK